MTVLMVGSTGHYAGLVLPELKKRGARVRALVRGSDQADAARRRGADETVTGDLTDPDSLLRAAEGVDGVFHINPAFAADAAAMGTGMVEAAVKAGVGKFVFSSVYHPSLSLSNHADKRPVEEAAYDSGMDFTVLQPAMFMQMLDSSWVSARDHGQVVGPYSRKSRMCYVDYRDVAEAAAIALTGDALSFGTFELCSPGMFDRVELAALMSTALGRPVEALELTPDSAVTTMPEGPMRAGVTAMMTSYDRYGFRGGNPLVLQAVLGRAPRSVQDYINELAEPRSQNR